MLFELYLLQSSYVSGVLGGGGELACSVLNKGKELE